MKKCAALVSCLASHGSRVSEWSVCDLILGRILLLIIKMLKNFQATLTQDAYNCFKIDLVEDRNKSFHDHFLKVFTMKGCEHGKARLIIFSHF